MALVRTKLPLGSFKVRGQKVEINAKRGRGFVEKFQKLKSDGVRIGVPWSHFETASPGNTEFLNTRLNAGYVDDLKLVDGGKALEFTLDCPGLKQGEGGALLSTATLPDGRKVETCIKEISPGIWDKWVDGQGVEHRDLIGHVALCMMPVVAGQEGFTGLSTMKSTANVTYLSSEFEDLQEDVEEAIENDEEKNGEPDLETLLKPADVVNSPDDERMSRLLAMLAEGGMRLPPDTSKENFMERLETAVGVLLDQQRKAAAAVPVDPPAEPPVVEEGSPAGTMMSTRLTMLNTLYRDIKSNPTMRSFFEGEVDRRRKDRESRITSLVKDRMLKPEVGDQLRANKIFLSTIVGDDGKLCDDETDRMIALLEKVLPEKAAATYLSSITQVTEHKGPMSGNEKVKVGNIEMTAAQAAEVEERVKRNS